MTSDTGQTDQNAGPGWWKLVEDHLATLSREAEAERAGPAPWSDASTGVPALTAEQRAFLTGDDQPGVPRLVHPDHGPDDQPPVPRFGGTGDTGADRAFGSTTGNIPGDAPENLS
jgi:hypothetical protein